MSDTQAVDASASTPDAASTSADTTAAAPAAVDAGTIAPVAAPAQATAPAGAPESYADFTLPEGVQLGEVADEIKATAKELGMTQDAAQKMVDIGAKLAAKAQADQAALVQSIQSSWQDDVRADKEIGGPNLDANLARARAALEATSTPQLRVLLDKSGLGNHPEVIRHFLKIAPAYLQDTYVAGGTKPVGSGKTAAQVLYDAA